MKRLLTITLAASLFLSAGCVSSQTSQTDTDEAWKKAHAENARRANRAAQQQADNQRIAQNTWIQQTRIRNATPPSPVSRPVFTPPPTPTF